MVNRKQLERIAHLRAKPRIIARGLTLALAFSPALCTFGCDSESSEAEDLAAEEGFELQLEVSDVRIASDRIEFKAGAHTLELALVRNTQLLARNAVIVRDGVELTPEQAGLEIPYRGYVVGDPNSWIRVRVTDAGFEGLIHTSKGLWEVRESETGKVLMTHSSLDDYLNIKAPDTPHRTCATSDAEAAHATYAYGSKVGEASAKCQQISIALVSDYTHVQKLGGAQASENEMLARMNETDGIYRADLNYGFSVGEVHSFSSSGGPSFNSKNAGNLPLDKFASYKGSELAEYGLAHLFLGRVSSGTVGLAYIATTCRSSKGAGVSNYLGKGKGSTVIVAHEIGHNFGAEHDKNGAPYIMAPSIDHSATTFSKSSHQEIDAHVNSVSCFTPCDAQQPGPGPGPEPDPDDSSCEGYCGEEHPDGCWCDDQCSDYGDCCGDYQDVCELPDEPDPDPEPDPEPDPDDPSCEGFCGDEHPDGCWCDDQCSDYGDCCGDYQDVCELPDDDDNDDDEPKPEKPKPEKPNKPEKPKKPKPEKPNKPEKPKKPKPEKPEKPKKPNKPKGKPNKGK